MAQYNYNNEWKKVTALDNKGLPQSALTVVTGIYNQAVKDGREAEIIKALIFRMNYQEHEENSDVKNLATVDQQLQQFKGPVHAILESMKGEMLWRYLQSNRYRLYNRTALAEDTTSDVSSWGMERLNREIASAYNTSLENTAQLQKISLAAYEEILQKGNARALRPTLYDLLAHRALDYFKSGENNMAQPADLFELDDPLAFAPAADFAAHTFTAADTTSLQFRALQLLQALIAFHEKDKPAALLDVDLERLAYVNQAGVMANKDELYVKALQHAQQAYAKEPEVARVMYMLAQHYYQQDQQEKDSASGKAAMAAALCRQAIQRAPESYGAGNCRQLLRQIEARELQLTTELVNLPGQPFRTLVGYRNLQRIYLRVVRINESFRQQLRNAQNDYRDTTNRYWRLITGRKPQQQWEQGLPNPEDYRQHHTEIKVDALPLGQYMLLAATTPDFSIDSSILAVQFIHVSELSYISRGRQNYLVLHRETGAPLAGVQLKVWQMVNSGGTRNDKLLQTATTDANGQVTLKDLPDALSVNIRLQCTLEKDTLFTDNYTYLYNYHPATDNHIQHPQSFLFTDRAIYRPGQTVYFKGIMVKKDPSGKGGNAIPGLNTLVQLRDANGEKVDSLPVTTNDYGAYNGTFKLPEGTLNGRFSLVDTTTGNDVDFSVEEYKRPRFYVEFDTVKGSYRVGDTVTVHGKALAYAGNNIDGAQVKYRVVREARFPYFWMFMFRPTPVSASREIAHGQLQTSADGTFTISFTALPDKQVKPELKPIFTYRVYADVTDLNGETRSGEQRLAAGYQLLEVKLDAPDELTAKDLEKIKITTANLNGTFEPASVHMRLLPLQAPDRLIRPRYWEAPDQFVLSETAFLQAFPLDVYKHENEPAQWPRKAPVLEKTFTTTQDSSAALAVKTLPAGAYELEVTATDKLGAPVVQKKIFNIVNPDAGQLPYPAYFSILEDGTAHEPGNNTKLVIGSSAKHLHIQQSIERWNQAPEDKFIQLDAAQKAFTYPVTEKDRGGLRITYTAVKDNRLFIQTHDIHVPWDNKTLDVQVATHRDKLLPGEKEKWQVQINGYKKDQVAAELLAAMYDASLDAFTPHSWPIPPLYPSFMPGPLWEDARNFIQEQSFNRFPPVPPLADSVIVYDALNWFNWQGAVGGGIVRKTMASGVRIRGVAAPPAPMMAAQADAMREVAVAGYAKNALEGKVAGLNTDVAAEPEAPVLPPAAVTPRTNFNETAFFYPDLHTDKDGNISFEFTVPEALTRWRFMGLAHTKDMAFGYTETSILTQKPLMVQPNAPRFMREGDRMEFSAKISNLADSTLIGQARLELLDAVTMQPVDGWFQNTFPVQHFTAYKGQSTVVTFPVQIPYHFNSALLYRVVARSGQFSDGEENALPVLTNSMLVTETLPLALRGDGQRSFTFDKLLHSDTSETLQQHALTVEFTGNPAWYAVQALPYLMEYPHQCAEQTFNRYYANALASHMANAMPGIKAVFEQWRTKDTAALQSNLQKNGELKAVLLQQTPWVLEAKNEAEQKARIALLFDLHRMSGELSKALGQLKQMQLSSGAFPWFNGMWEDRFITQYIVTGIGRLQQLDALDAAQQADCSELADKALSYLDMQLDKDYQQLLKEKADMKKEHISSIQVHYLYMRSFYKDKPLPAKYKAAYDYYLGQAKKYWLQQNRFAQAMTAVALYRHNDEVTPAAILKSLKENAITNDEMGMYWKTPSGYWWYQAPVETQVMLIEAFEVAGHDSTAVNDMKTWLLKNKQTNNWHTTKATADACYAMLLGGGNWLAANPQVTIQLGSATINSADEATEAGTGYFKKRLDAKEVKPGMGHIQVSLQGSNGQPAWGAVYWQYFEQLDKITPSQTPLQLEKQLFIQQDTDKGPVLNAITGSNRLKVGDKVKVRIVLRADRDMEYIHLRDMRAACFEPQNVISSSKWQNGLSYYESTKDASTDFFFSRLPKGTHVFEYTLFVTHEGEFSNGISTAQCMYAPEFSAHSEGINVRVEK